MKRSNITVLFLAVWIELVANLLTDHINSKLLLMSLITVMVIHWYRQRPRLPWHDDDDWL